MQEKFVDIDKYFSLIFTPKNLIFNHIIISWLLTNYLYKALEVLILVNTNHSKFKESLEWH